MSLIKLDSLKLDAGERRSGFRTMVAHALRPKQSRQVLRKRRDAGPGGSDMSSGNTRIDTSIREVAAKQDLDFDLATGERYAGREPLEPQLTPWEEHRCKYKDVHAKMDTQTGEYQDYTTMLHSLGAQDDVNDWDFAPLTEDDSWADRPPGERAVASLSVELWTLIARHLDAKDTSSLALANTTLYRRLAPAPFLALNRPENYALKISFLAHTFDRQLPHHLLCFPCAKYHRRAREGRETLQPASVLNPLFRCPNARNVLRPQPRLRITHGRPLPYSFVQLLTRPHRHASRVHGLADPDVLTRRWRRDGWTHAVRFHVNPANGHLLMRVASQAFAAAGLTPSQQRLLLFSREDYVPYFSVCAHWRDGNLLAACKCALAHVPPERATPALVALETKVKDAMAGRAGYDPNALASLCGVCRPMRRCPDCPTEHLIEVKLTEDREAGPSGRGQGRFRHALCVTRWSDLGDGLAPMLSPEWAAVNGVEFLADAEAGEARKYDSFRTLGKRSIAGVFESAFTHDIVPGQRIVSMNPEGRRRTDEESGWY